VQLLAGHQSIQTTQRYIDGDTDAQRKLVSLIFNSAIPKLLIGNSNRRRGGGLALHFQSLGSG
jgi:hypothetical protein